MQPEIIRLEEAITVMERAGVETHEQITRLTDKLDAADLAYL